MYGPTEYTSLESGVRDFETQPQYFVDPNAFTGHLDTLERCEFSFPEKILSLILPTNYWDGRANAPGTETTDVRTRLQGCLFHKKHRPRRTLQ